MTRLPSADGLKYIVINGESLNLDYNSDTGRLRTSGTSAYSVHGYVTTYSGVQWRATNSGGGTIEAIEIN